MNEPGWIAFADGAWEIQKQLGVGWADACRRLRVACREEWITTMLAPYENENQLPREFWTGPVGPSEWRQRDVDCSGLDADGCTLVAMLNEDDFRCWCAAKPKKPRAVPKDDLARNTIAKLNIPAEMTNKEALQRVVEVLSAQGIRNVPSLSVIKRARAKKSMN
jgi:hypothetical protein